MATGERTKESLNGAKGATPRATWPFGGDHVMQATAQMQPKHRDAVRWLFFHCIENGLSIDEAAKAIRYDKTTVYRVCRGDYGAGLGKVVAAVLSYKNTCDRRTGIPEGSFVETNTARKIWKVCDAAVAYKTIAFIFGDSQVGKTTALQEYARRNNHGQTKYIRMAASSGTQLMMKLLAEACAFSPKGCFENLRKRVLGALDENTLVIVDELHLAFFTYHSKARLSCLEVLRELHDRTGCAMVLCGTNVGRDEIDRGPQKEYLEQLRRRGVFRLQLPKYATQGDLNAIAKSFGLPPAEGEAADLVKQIIRANGLKAYTSYLQAAGRIASNTRRKLAWKHFIQAHDVIAKLSDSKGGN